ncbi:MAG: hypothetical protein JO270_00510 [Acidobacteriaceae bacterium]|nr:hypothetical protein [Acidobacteriaceae bacterium]MBV8573205.1 hypothetical protein [Acidobacteriaceae bacterium]
MRLVIALMLAGMTAQGASYFVTVAGLGGMPEYDKQFADWAAGFDRQFKESGPGAHVITLSGNSATKQRIGEVFSQLAHEVQPGDSFALLLIGHGSFDGVDYKINIPGPDATAGELAAWLNQIPAQRQLVVNMTSCSGASLPALARKDRIVIVATKSGNEKNATVFPRYWLDALHDPAADADKDGNVSALEAFAYTQRKVAAYFESEKLLATEHPMMSDTGNFNAVRDPKPENGQGLLAGSFILMRPEMAENEVTAPAKQKLVAKKDDLEAKIDRLKYQKAAMNPEEYKQQLAALLLELAKIQAEIDE